MVLCPQCGGTQLKRSRARGPERLFKSLSSYKTYRCSDCKWRGWLSTGRGPWAGILKKSKPAILFLGSAVLIGAATWLIAEAFL